MVRCIAVSSENVDDEGSPQSYDKAYKSRPPNQCGDKSKLERAERQPSMLATRKRNEMATERQVRGPK